MQRRRSSLGDSEVRSSTGQAIFRWAESVSSIFDDDRGVSQGSEEVRWLSSSVRDSELRPFNDQAHFSRAEWGSSSILDDGREVSQRSEEVRWLRSSLRDSDLPPSNDPPHFSWADLRSSSSLDNGKGVSQGWEEVQRVRRSSRNSESRPSNDQAHFSRAESGSSSILDNGRAVSQGRDEVQRVRRSSWNSESRPSNDQAHFSRAESGSSSILDNGRGVSQGWEEAPRVRRSSRFSESRPSNDQAHFSRAESGSSSILDNGRGVSQGREEVQSVRRSSRSSELPPANDQAHFSRAESGSSSILNKGKGVSQGGSEEELLEIPRATVHLVDGQGSVHLADGVFSIIRLSRDGRAIAVFAKVGENLRWPLTKDESANKLDTHHYLFTLKVPRQAEEGQSEDLDSEEDSKILNYGVTFRAEDADQSLLLELDEYLRRYSFFKVPDVVRGEEREAESEAQPRYGRERLYSTAEREPQPNYGRERLYSTAEREPQPNYGRGMLHSTDERTQKRRSRLEAFEEYIFGAPISAPDAFNDRYGDNKRKSVDGRSSDYWANLAPNVDAYSNSMAKGIASQTGSVIEGLLWCSKATVDQLERGGDYVKARVRTKEQATLISPRTMKNLRRVRTLSRMTDRIAKGVLAGIVTATGIVSGSVVGSRAGKEFFKLAPGEVALASLDAFGSVFDAVELAGRGVLRSTSMVTSGVVTHRYGEEAGEASMEGMATLGHVLSLAWTVAKIRRAFTKSIVGNAGFSKRALLKSAIASASTRSSTNIPT